MQWKSEKKPVKPSMYRNIFHKEFNISFYKPRKERWHYCELMHTANTNNDETSNSNTFVIKYNNHVDDKKNSQNERNDDKKDFPHKMKLNTYNLTVHCSTDKAAHSAIWIELEAGRRVNKTASALVNISWNKLSSSRNQSVRTLVRCMCATA